MLSHQHHIAIICSDYNKAKAFYMDKLGFQLFYEVYREAEKDHLIMARSGELVLELFIRPDAPQRVTDPEAMGLRHLAFHVANMEETVAWLNGMGIETEPVRISTVDGKKMTFFRDPDGLPLELHE